MEAWVGSARSVFKSFSFLVVFGEAARLLQFVDGKL
jgi:hypothetical protein